MPATELRGNTQIQPGTVDIGIKKECRFATTAAITLASNGLAAVDGVALVAGDRILVKNQASGAENGIYDAAVGAWTRSLDADDTGKVLSGEVVFIGPEGTANPNTGFINSTVGIITVATTAQEFTKFTAVTNPIEVSEYIVRETPGGVVNGSNTAFTIANPLEVGTEHLYKNGQLQEEGAGDDYTISGTAITMIIAPKGSPGNPDILRVSYIAS